MQQILIITVIGLAAMALLVYLFSLLGKQEVNSDPRRVEELWVHAHGDPAMVKLYYKAHSDEERAQIVHFIHSTCPEAPGPGEEAAVKPDKPGKKSARRKTEPKKDLASSSVWETTGETTSDTLQATDQLLAGMEEEDELDEALLTRQERKALRKKEKEEKAAAKAAAKEAARQQAIAEAKKVKLSQGVNGVPEEYPDLEAALAAAISKAENQDPAENPPAADPPDPTEQPEAENQPEDSQSTLVLDRSQIEAALHGDGNAQVEPDTDTPAMEQPEAENQPEDNQSTLVLDRSQIEAALHGDGNAQVEPTADTPATEQPEAANQPEDNQSTLVLDRSQIEAALHGDGNAQVEPDTDTPATEQPETASMKALSAAPAAPPEEAVQNAPASSPVCPHCGAETVPGCKFCIVCGLPLTEPGEEAPSPAQDPVAATDKEKEAAPSEALSATPAAPPEEAGQSAPAPSPVCPHCGAETLPGCKFCIVCGLPLTEPAEEAPSPAQDPVEILTKILAEENQNAAPDEAASVPASQPPTAEETQLEAGTASPVCPHCGAQVPAGCVFCVICGKSLEAAPTKATATENVMEEGKPSPAASASDVAASELPVEGGEVAVPTAPPTGDETVKTGSYWDPFADRSQIADPQQNLEDPLAETVEPAAGDQKEEAQIASSLNALDAELKAVQATIDAWTAQPSPEPGSGADLSLDPEAEPVETPTAPAGSYWDPFADRSQMIADRKTKPDGAEEESPVSVAQRVLQDQGHTDLSATLGLPQALSLEEILRNVRELEKRISKESETTHHEE